MLEAVQENDAERVRQLVQADPSLARVQNDAGVSVVLLARYRRRMEALAALLECVPDLDIFEAAAVGDAARLRDLLDADPELVNAFATDGFYPLGLAAFFNHAECVQLLLERGADARAVARNEMQVQALHAAVADKAEADALVVATLLLDHGAPVNATQQGGYTPLHEAAQSGHARLADLLLARGADATARLDDGRTPATVAAEHGHATLARRLTG